MKVGFGFLHNPPNIPYCFENADHYKYLFNTAEFKESLLYCKGIFVLSDYHKKWLKDYFFKNNISVMVNSLIHPCEEQKIKFSWKKYINNPKKTVIQMGYWLRKMNFIFDLKVPDDHSKLWLYSGIYAFTCFIKENSKTKPMLCNQ